MERDNVGVFVGRGIVPQSLLPVALRDGEKVAESRMRGSNESETAAAPIQRLAAVHNKNSAPQHVSSLRVSLPLVITHPPFGHLLPMM